MQVSVGCLIIFPNCSCWRHVFYLRQKTIDKFAIIMSIRVHNTKEINDLFLLFTAWEICLDLCRPKLNNPDYIIRYCKRRELRQHYKHWILDSEITLKHYSYSKWLFNFVLFYLRCLGHQFSWHTQHEKFYDQCCFQQHPGHLAPYAPQSDTGQTYSSTDEKIL